MNTCSALLGAHAARIAAAVADVTDMVLRAEPLREVIVQLANASNSKQALDLTPLRVRGADDNAIAKLLRATLAESVELLRAQGPHLPVAEYVVALRDCVRRSLRRPSSVGGHDPLYRELLEGRCRPDEAKYRRLFSFTEGVLHSLREFVYVHDTEGAFLYVDPRGLALIKFGVEDVLDGLSIYDIVLPKYFDVIEEQISLPGEARRSPSSVEIYTKEGERIPVELSTRALVGENGGPATVMGVGHDLRLERRLHEEIQRSNVHLERVMTNIPAGVLITDSNAAVRDANPAALAMLGAPSLRSIVGLPAADIFEECRGLVDCAFTEAKESGRDIRIALSTKTLHGAALHCELVILPTHLHAHAHNGLVLFLLEKAPPVA